MTAWSYSSIKMFDQCPKKYHHIRVLKDVKDEGSEAINYGNDLHKAAELYIKKGIDIPAKYAFILPLLSGLRDIEGAKHCEIKLGVRKTKQGFEACDFFDGDVWWRGIADLLITCAPKAFMVDYKTGKNAKYADPKQLDLLAGAVFLHFPDVMSINSALTYVVSGECIRKKHVTTERGAYLAVFDQELNALAGAEQSGVWNAKSGPLCGWCPVTKCEHNRRKS